MSVFSRFLPFWIFLLVFKISAGLHYSLLSPLGEKIFPLWAIGLLIGGSTFFQLLFDVPAGRLLDRYGYRKLLRIATFIFLFAPLCFFFGLSPFLYILTIVIATLGWQFYGPGVNAYLLSQAPKNHAGHFMSYRDVFGSLGVVIASAALPFVIPLEMQTIAFLLWVFLLVAFFMIILSPKDHTSVHQEIKISTHHHYIQRQWFGSTLKAMRQLNPASTMLTLLTLSGCIFYGVIWFTVPLVIANSQDGKLLGVGLGIFDLAIVCLGFLLGLLADKVNKRMLVYFGLILFGICGTLLGFHFGWLFLLFGFLATTGDEMASISLWAWLHNLDKKHAQDGVVASVISVFEDLGWTIGPIFAGFAYPYLGASWTIVFGALPIFVTWIVYQFLLRHHAYPAQSLLELPKKPHRFRHKN